MSIRRHIITAGEELVPNMRYHERCAFNMVRIGRATYDDIDRAIDAICGIELRIEQRSPEMVSTIERFF